MTVEIQVIEVLILAVLFHQLLEEIVRVQIRMLGGFNQLLVSVFKIKRCEKFVENKSVGNFRLFSEIHVDAVWITDFIWLLWQHFLIETFFNEIFGVVEISDLEEFFYTIEDIDSDIIGPRSIKKVNELDDIL